MTERRALKPGHVYGNLTVTGCAGKNKHGQYLVRCMCICGTEKEFREYAVRQGTAKSCGCTRHDCHTKHGMSDSAAYRSWLSMIARCMNPEHPHFGEYGGRGITICKEWQRFEGFYADMGDRPKSTSLDRKDSNLGYCKSNCRWATAKEQGNNRRTNTVWSWNGQSKTVQQWADALGVNSDTLTKRFYKHGWPIEKVLSTPVRSWGSNRAENQR